MTKKVSKPPVFVMKTGGFGPSGETRTRGILVPNQAPYQLGHTRINYFNNSSIIHNLF